jgi:hypothetical protein
MDSREIDKLLEQGLLGDSPGQAFRARVLLDSTAALTRRRRMIDRWRPMALSAAAVLIAAVSFLLGRCSVGPLGTQQAAPPVVADMDGAVAVPSGLVAWLQAAQIFRQLGMEDRMARAVERAASLLPRDAASASGTPTEAFLAADSGARDDQRGESGLPGASSQHQSFEIVNRIMAESTGGYGYANGMD